MRDPELRVVADAPAVAAEAAGLFVDLAPRTIVLSGGSTPEALYRRLAGVDHPWAETECFFGDERCVPPDDARSNLGMARAALLDGVEARVYPVDGAACDAVGYERALRERFGERPWFDLAVYGLGPDGHTASLFPGKPAVLETQPWAVRVPDPGLEPFVPRVTLTAPVLSSAAVGMFLVTGAGKRWALSALLAGEDIPAALMRPERLVIVADREAAGTAG